MKSLIKDIAVFIAAIIGELYVFLQMPYMEVTQGHGDGFIILMPVFVTPIIGIVLGILAKRKFIFALPIIVAFLSILLMLALCQEFMPGYFIIFTSGSLIGIGIGCGIRKLIIQIIELIRERKSK